MPAPKGNQYAVGNPGGGRKTKYDPKYAQTAEVMCKLGATDMEVAEGLGVSIRTIYAWKVEYQDFAAALKMGKDECDDRVEKSLYNRAIGYKHEDVDIRVIDGQVVQTPIVKHYPPDTVAGIFWLKNRRSQEWRDKVHNEHTGKDGGPIQMQFSATDADL